MINDLKFALITSLFQYPFYYNFSNAIRMYLS